MYKQIFAFLSMLWPVFVSHQAWASVIDFMPVVTNFSQSTYDGGLQNWSIAQTDEGLLCFGNQKGLLTYDGYQWTCSMLPSHAIVRSVLADGDRIYVGSYTDFGYFKRDVFGTYRYTSLWPKNYKSRDDEIWKIIKAPNGHIYFQSFCSWFDYDGHNTVAHFDQSHLPLHFFKVGRQVYVQMVNGGLFELRGSRYVPLLARSDYGDDDIVAMFAHGTQGLLCVTSRNGLFLLQGGKLSPWRTDIDDALRASQANNATMLDRHTLVVGTILNGIFAISLETGRSLWHCNMANSLCNNTVLGLLTDKSDNIWAALDNGLALVHTALPVTVMRTGPTGMPIGMVYGICRTGGSMYVATNQSLWRYDMGTREMRQVARTGGQNWYVSALGQQVLAGHNLTTMAVTGDEATPLVGVPEGSTCLRRYQVDGQDALIEAGYGSLRVYRMRDGRWQLAHIVQGFHAPILEFEIDSDGSIWGAHFSKGVYRLDLSADLRRVVRQRYYGAPTPGGIHGQMHVLKIRGRVVMAYQQRLYTYDDIKGRMVPYRMAGHALPGSLVSATPIDNNTFWTSDATAFSLFGYDGRHYRRRVHIPYKMFGLEANTNGVAQYVDGKHTYFFLNNGIGRYTEGTRAHSDARFPLTIAGVTTTTSDNLTQQVAIAGDSPHRISAGNLRLQLSYPSYDNQLLTYRCTLEGGGKDVVTEQETPVFAFNSLGYGNYKVKAEVLSADGVILATATYAFVRVTPFYLSVWAILVYAAVCFLLIRMYVNWRTNKIVRRNRHKAEEELMRQNLKVLEQKQIIAAQQRIIMENELTSKSKDLASLALKMAVQRENSEVLRGKLLDKKQRGLLTDRDFRELITKAEGTDSGEVWDIFEQNFDLIHKNFFRNLRTRFPDLTATDLKFCALLRLNLNTKEIAKYTNLTIRGVEGARYRLRKKMDIRNDQSLTEFLIDLK